LTESFNTTTATLEQRGNVHPTSPIGLATVSGLIAILSWSPASLIIVYLQHLPIMLVIGVSFSVCFMVVAIKLTYSRTWSIVREAPWQLWLFGILGIYGNNICYLVAVKFAPIAHVVLIGYLWPITVIFLSSLIFKQPIIKRQIVATLIAFTGVAVLISQGKVNHDVAAHYYIGYLLAFASGSLWALFCVVSTVYRQTRVELVGLYCGIGALISLLSYWFFDQHVAVNVVDMTLMISLGLTAFGLAFLFWDHGIKFGNFKFLCISAFFIPLLSTLWLILFGKAEPTMILFFTLACVIVGSYLAKS